MIRLLFVGCLQVTRCTLGQWKGEKHAWKVKYTLTCTQHGGWLRVVCRFFCRTKLEAQVYDATLRTTSIKKWPMKWINILFTNVEASNKIHHCYASETQRNNGQMIQLKQGSVPSRKKLKILPPSLTLSKKPQIYCLTADFSTILFREYPRYLSHINNTYIIAHRAESLLTFYAVS